jgi:hypothetical protein
MLRAADAPPHLRLEQLTAQSDAIVAGRVMRAWAAMDSENRFIWTHYEIKVRDTLKGQAHATVEVTEPGGVLNGHYLRVSGSTPFAVGEDVAVFLYRTPIGYLRTTNYGQGKFPFAEGAGWNVFRAQVAHIVALQRGHHR